MTTRVNRLDDADWMAGRRREGWSDKRIAAELGVGAPRVRDVLRRHGLPPRLSQVKFPQLYDDDWMRGQLAAGRSMADVARSLGCSTRSARDAAARVGRVPTPRPRRPAPALLDDPAWLADQLARRSVAAVADELDTSKERVTAAARRHHVTIPRAKRVQFPELRDPDWLAARSHTHTVADVADELGCSIHTVKAAVWRNGVTLLGDRVRTRR